MAVDTRNKRFSLLGLALAAISVLPNPDGAIDSAGERQQYLWAYSGIAFAPVAVLPDVHRTFTASTVPHRISAMTTPQRVTASTTPRRMTVKLP